ncbi:hypothetical protein JQ633_00885 [Bradyrhizobium tropiciagri]|uniref:hypothetical protein n=1 Tax=Bradyrhizobium tropiciagri TaxID=312253 RepID=UPI001BA4E9B4|nr:hypothetical protein [Bradyrhizobium tropiciagri]MBR0868895.1 hypothetical protein [Bradyrhizobium tropiciagri]
MRLSKARARSLLLENANCHATTGYDSETRQLTYALNCYGSWEQGKGHSAEYKVEMTKIEMMLRVVQDWMKILHDHEARLAQHPPQELRHD